MSYTGVPWGKLNHRNKYWYNSHLPAEEVSVLVWDYSNREPGFSYWGQVFGNAEFHVSAKSHVFLGKNCNHPAKVYSGNWGIASRFQNGGNALSTDGHVSWKILPQDLYEGQTH